MRWLATGTAIAVTAAAAAVLTTGGEGAAAPSGRVLEPPTGGDIYHAAYPDFSNMEDRVEARRISAFEDAAAEPIAWAYFSNNWFRGEIEFPAAAVDVIHDAGRVPFIRLMARSGYGSGPDPNFSMRSIATGRWDDELTEWCDAAAATPYPLLAEFGTEVNGDWFPWNGRWNGGGRTSGYGDPRLADGPESFRDAFRHLVELCDARGADDITWFFHVDVGSWPERSWNQPWDYYPGDDVVDWVGLSDYGPLKPGQRWTSFRSRMDAVYDDLVARIGADKPFAVLEYGAAEQPGHPRRKADWIRRAIDLVADGRWSGIRALSYWHERWRNGDGSRSDLHIDSTRRSRRAYRRGVDAPTFTSRPNFGPG